MAQYPDHLNQVNSNLKFLASINEHSNKFVDWQVTTAFYAGVHLINSFLAREVDAHFNSHERVKHAISPDSSIAKTRLDESTYLAYVKLRNLSRRSRYLCSSEGDPNAEVERAHFILEKHFTKAFIHLDKLLCHFYSRYNDAYEVTTIMYAFNSPTPNCKFFKFQKHPVVVAA
jgi:hypothetical protein